MESGWERLMMEVGDQMSDKHWSGGNYISERGKWEGGLKKAWISINLFKNRDIVT